jgi:hypothetical protein
MRRRLLGTGRRLIAAIGAFAVLGAVACSSTTANDTKGSGGATGGEADAGEWNNQYDVTVHDGGSLPPPTDFSKIPDPWSADTEAACVAFAPDYPASRACFCKNCLELMHQCDALPGCIEVRACIWKSGCTDPNSCYLYKMSGDSTGCVDVIDKWGNSGVAVATSNNLGQCAKQAPTPCPQPAQ